MPKGMLIAIAVLLFPAVFIGGAQIMSALSGRKSLEGEKPLNRRWGGYRVDDAASFWGELDKHGLLRAEQRFLELDLLFPVFYGSALAASLLIASALFGWPVQRLWLVVPVVIGVLADWFENLNQLEQIRNFVDHGKDGLVARCVQIASTATVVKLYVLTVSTVLLYGLIIAFAVSKVRAGS